MRTANVCPTCSTFINALCVIYDGPLLATLDIQPTDSLEVALQKIETFALTGVPGSSIITQDEGVTVDLNAGVINFIGAGVTATDAGGNITNVTIPGEVNDLTSSVTWADVPDANITLSSVQQHQSLLSITESQISDLQSYMLASQQLAQSKPLVAGEFLTSYDAGTGLFTSATPTYFTPTDLPTDYGYTPLSVGNGLTDNSGTIDLGGDITADVDLLNTTSAFFRIRMFNPGFTQWTALRIDTDEFDVEARHDTSGNEGNVRFVTSSSSAIGLINVRDTARGGYREITFTSTGDWFVNDQITSKGLVYQANYHTNYTDRSIVDKEYVDLSISNNYNTAATTPVEFTYANSTAMIADQGNQTSNYFQYVNDTDTYYEYLGTLGGVIGDYREVTDGDEITVIRGSRTYTPVHIVYASEAVMFVNQKFQRKGYIYRTSDTDTHYEYLGTKTVSLADYKIISIDPTGLEAIDEGNGIGWRLIGRNPANHGNIGKNAIDFSAYFSVANQGALGDVSFAAGSDNIAGGYGSFVGGYGNNASESFATIFGQTNSNAGYASLISGLNNTIQTNGNYGSILGHDSNLVGYFSNLLGTGLIGKSTSTTVVGQANLDYTNTSGSVNIGTAPHFIVGNGTIGAGPPNAVTGRSNALEVLHNGSVIAPSLTNGTIDAGVDEILVTKGWITAQGFGGGAQSWQDIHDGTDGTNNFANNAWIQSPDTNTYFDVTAANSGSYFDYYSTNTGSYANIETVAGSLFKATNGSMGVYAEKTYAAEGQKRYTDLFLNIDDFYVKTVNPNNSSRGGGFEIIGDTSGGGERVRMYSIKQAGIENRLDVAFPNASSTAIHRVIIPAPLTTSLTTRYATLGVTANSSTSYADGDGIIDMSTVENTSKGYTVATLPTAVTGVRAFVTDSTVTAAGNFGATVVGGGSNVVPVFYDGTNWIIA